MGSLCCDGIHGCGSKVAFFDGSSKGGYVITMAPNGPFIEGHMADPSLRGQPQTSGTKLIEPRNSAGVCNTDCAVVAARLLYSELQGYTVTKHSLTDAVKATPGIVVLDAQEVHDTFHNCSSTALG